MKKIINLLLVLSLFTVNFSIMSVSADYDAGEIYTIYENNFDNGSASVPMASADGYAAQNEFMDFDGILGQPLENSEMSGNMGVRIRAGAWQDERTFLFDFTKGGAKRGLSSGILTMGFDFSLDGDSGADFAIIGANMAKAYEGNRMAYFHRGGKLEILTYRGGWGSSANAESLDCDKIYNLKAVINLDEGKTDYYLDDVLVKTQTNWKSVTVNNLAISLSGIIDYFDNLQLTFQCSQKVETAHSYTVYENTFDSGAASVPAASADGYAAQNEFMDFDGILGQPLENSEMSGNMGVRVRQGAWMSDRTFLFDFTKGGTKKGIYSGVWTVSFDFSLDAASSADGAIMGMNMSKTYEGGRMVYFFKNGKVEILSSYSAWGSSSHSDCISLDCDAVYKLKTVINFDEEKADYYLDNNLIRTQTNLKNVTMNNFAISLSGVLDYLDNLKITAQYPNSTENIITSNNIGNIFYDDEPVALKLTTINRHNKPVSDNINIVITDTDNNVVWRMNRHAVMNESEKEVWIYPELPLFGTYFLKITSDNSREFTTRLSRSVRADVLNDKLGVCAHFDGRYNLDVAGVFEIMSALGVGSVRTDWGCRFNSDGSVYDYDSDGGYFESTIDEAQKHGIDILAILGISVAGSGSNGGFNTDADALLSYQNYCRKLAQKLKGKVEQFELGNENNYGKRRANRSDVGVNKIVLSNGRTLIDENYVYVYSDDYNNPKRYSRNSVNCTVEEKANANGGVYSSLSAECEGVEILNDIPAYVFETGENYYNILKAGYDGIKAGNPDASVATSGSQVVYTDPDGTMNRNNREFAHGLLGAAQANSDYCFDIYAVHPYHNGQPPETADRWIKNTKWHEQGIALNNLFTEYSVPQEKQKWATEYGYSARDSAEDSSNAKKKAAWIVRTILANEIYGCYDRMYLYDILNDGLDASEGEHNFGTICCYKDEAWYNVSAYAAKPQYLALAQYNKMTAECEFIQNTISSDTIYMSEFGKDGGSVFAVWNTAGKNQDVTVSGEGRIVKVYDMYGNIIDRAENTDSVTVTAGEMPVYVEFLNPKTEIRLSENTGEVTIVNNTDEVISPIIFVAVTDGGGRLVQLYDCAAYTVNGAEVLEIEPGQLAKATVNTDYEGYGVKVMLFRDTESLTPMCASQSK